MNKLKMANGMVQDYTIVLCTRNYKKLGQIAKLETVNTNTYLSQADELSFSINKSDLINTYDALKINKKLHKKIVNDLWDKIVDFKLVWIKEIDKYFSIKVSIIDGLQTIKTITGITLCEEELSQFYIYSMEINTEDDIARDDYDVNFPTVMFRNPEDIGKYNEIWNTNPELYTVCQTEDLSQIDEEATYKKRYDILKNSSLLHRSLDKAPHYSIGHVDASLYDLQRTFSISGTSIYDFLTGECAEQFNCLFLFDSSTRTINVYDLYTVCKDCGYRGDDFYDQTTGTEFCPKCKGTNIQFYGEDTTIFIDKNNLTEEIQLDTNADNIKNCFKLTAGDELMTAAVRTLNPNGSDYIYYISRFQRQDMSSELITRLDEYDLLYNENIFSYEELIEQLWEYQSEIDKLEHTMMPTLEHAEVTAQTEITKIKEAYEAGTLDPIGVSNITSATVSTVDSTIKNYLKTYVKSGCVKITIGNSKYTQVKNSDNTVVSGLWTGTVTLENYSDKEDVAVLKMTDIKITGDYRTFVEQKILKSLAEQHAEEGSVFDVLALDDLTKFEEALTLYCRERLISFRDAIDGALVVLAELNQGESEALLYELLYTPYYQKLQTCETEIAVRDNQINKVNEQISKVNSSISQIQKKLNFQNFLGELYPEFCCYRREENYENSNYVSDGLTDSELLAKAKEFLEVANQELKKAGEPQYTLSSTLYNLLTMKEFEPIVKYFELGNWIRVKVDGSLYKLRLIGYSINFDALQTISVEFSNVTKLGGVVAETRELLHAASSMTSNYAYVSKQASNGEDAKNQYKDLVSDGLNTALIQVQNAKGEVVFTDGGLLCRSYDDEIEDFSPEQLKITKNVIAFTDNNWESVKQAVGKHTYIAYVPETNEWIQFEGYGVTSDFLSSGHIAGSTIVGGIIYSMNYSNGADGSSPAGTYIDLNNGTFSFAAGNLIYDGQDLIISENSLQQSLENVEFTLDKLHIRAENITGYIADAQISSISSAKIVGDISVSAKNITGLIESGQIKTVDVSQITGELIVESNNISGLIKDSQIESIASSKITGTIYANEADSVKATNIDGIINASQISDTLSDKIVTGNFSGQVEASSIKSMDTNGATYEGITGEYIIGEDTVLKIVNGIIVSVTQTVIDAVE